MVNNTSYTIELWMHLGGLLSTQEAIYCFNIQRGFSQPYEKAVALTLAHKKELITLLLTSYKLSQNSPF